MEGKVQNYSNQELMLKRLSLLEKILWKVEKSLEKAPEGRVRMGKSNGSVQFYYCKAGDNSNGQYIRKSEHALVRKLLQKEYDKKLKPVLQAEIKSLRFMIKQSRKTSPEDVYEAFPDAKKEWIRSYFENTADYVKAWTEEKTDTKGVIGVEGFHTEKGEIVRSKSEKMIADKLWKMGIPYCYECPLTLKNGRVIHPDFTILDIRNRQEVYLEHLGMMDNQPYAEGAVARINWYAESGIVLGRNLLLTFETLKTPFDVRILEELFRDYETCEVAQEKSNQPIKPQSRQKKN